MRQEKEEKKEKKKEKNLEKNKEKTAPLLTIENIRKYYPQKGGIIPHTVSNVKAVDGVDLAIAEGETLGLVGESGCGKSTMGRLLVGLEKPTEGRIYYNGIDLTTANRHQVKQIRTQIQIVFQDPYSSLNPRKHIYEILAQPMLYHQLASKDTIDQELFRLLDMVGLQKNVLGRYPHEFSGGQRQRIGIARALSLKPRFLVCDEPVSALDVSIQAQILNLIKSLQKELGLTVLFVGHGLGAVHYVSDRIAVMYLGKIVELGSAREVFRTPAHPYTKALVAAAPMPDPEQNGNHFSLLQGEVSSGAAIPSGCRFHPRCSFARAECGSIEPVLQKVTEGSDHMAACPFAAEGMLVREKSVSVSSLTQREPAAASSRIQEKAAAVSDLVQREPAVSGLAGGKPAAIDSAVQEKEERPC